MFDETDIIPTKDMTSIPTPSSTSETPPDDSPKQEQPPQVKETSTNKEETQTTLPDNRRSIAPSENSVDKKLRSTPSVLRIGEWTSDVYRLNSMRSSIAPDKAESAPPIIPKDMKFKQVRSKNINRERPSRGVSIGKKNVSQSSERYIFL